MLDCKCKGTVQTQYFATLFFPFLVFTNTLPPLFLMCVTWSSNFTFPPILIISSLNLIDNLCAPPLILHCLLIIWWLNKRWVLVQINETSKKHLPLEFLFFDFGKENLSDKFWKKKKGKLPSFTSTNGWYPSQLLKNLRKKRREYSFGSQVVRLVYRLPVIY